MSPKYKITFHNRNLVLDFTLAPTSPILFLFIWSAHLTEPNWSKVKWHCGLWIITGIIYVYLYCNSSVSNANLEQNIILPAQIKCLSRHIRYYCTKVSTQLNAYRPRRRFHPPCCTLILLLSKLRHSPVIGRTILLRIPTVDHARVFFMLLKFWRTL